MSTANHNSGMSKTGVLIVHPESTVRGALAHALKGEGWSVVVAGSALEAYNAMQQGVFAAAFIHSDIADQPGPVLADYLKRNFDMKVVMLSDEWVRKGEVSSGSMAGDGSVLEGEEYDAVLREANRLLQPGRTTQGDGPGRKWRLFSQD